jgi:pyruvate dehydrogenase (quinone)
VVDWLASDDAVLTCDSGTIATWAARHWRIRGDRQFFLSGNLATMAPGLPYAMAAQWAYPGRQCIAFIGDGGLAMLMAELDTAVRYNLPITVIVNNNASLGQIEWEQVVLGCPEYGVRYERSIDFAKVAEACGASGVRVGGPATSRPRSGPPSTMPALPWSTVTSTPTSPPPRPDRVHSGQRLRRGVPTRPAQQVATARTLVKDQIDKLRS